MCVKDFKRVHLPSLTTIPGPTHKCLFILLAFITGNTSLEPLLEGLFTQIHVRRTKLKNTWGVECMCSKCASDIAKAESNSQATARAATQCQETTNVRNRAKNKHRADDAEKKRIHNRYHWISLHTVAISNDPEDTELESLNGQCKPLNILISLGKRAWESYLTLFCWTSRIRNWI